MLYSGVYDMGAKACSMQLRWGQETRIIPS